MPRRRSEEDHEATIQQIKDVARGLMATNGAAGLSIRAIAREMKMTAPALYYYFASLDELTTALIVDSFNALADALEAARDSGQSAGKSASQQMWDAVMAYRQYALDHSIDFQLIYGSPIPGYEAPREITVPASARTLIIFTELMYKMMETGEITLTEPYANPPAEIIDHIAAIPMQNVHGIPLHAAYATFCLWPQIHGVVMLELFEHIGPVVGNVDLFYRRQMTTLFQSMGVTVDFI